MQQAGIATDAVKSEAEALRVTGASVMYLPSTAAWKG